MDKQDTRRLSLEARRALSSDETHARSINIANRVMELVGWDEVRSVHTYLPLPRENEVDTRLLIGLIRNLDSSIKLASWRGSKTDPSPVWLDNQGNLSDSDAQTLFDLIIVPVVAFDEERHRLGFGAGFYDRFLPSQPRAFTIGVAYEMAKHRFPHEDHDIALNAVITETRTYI